ncbi:MAG: site-specific integrase [Anaerolineales bacterium]
MRDLLAACDVRQKAIVMLLVDSGVRAAELCGLNWGDLNPQTGQLMVRLGKGRKDRVTVIGAKTMRALLAYRRTLRQPPTPDSPMIRGRTGQRFTADWLSHLMRRLGIETGIHVTPHALRRTFALMSLRSGMDILSLQRLMGHADIAMTSHYVQMLDADLIAAHEQHGLDRWL